MSTLVIVVVVLLLLALGIALLALPDILRYRRIRKM